MNAHTNKEDVMTYNYVVIKSNGLTVSGQAGSSLDATITIGRMAMNSFYNSTANPFRKAFVACDRDGLMEYTISECVTEYLDDCQLKEYRRERALRKK